MFSSIRPVHITLAKYRKNECRYLQDRLLLSDWKIGLTPHIIPSGLIEDKGVGRDGRYNCPLSCSWSLVPFVHKDIADIPF